MKELYVSGFDPAVFYHIYPLGLCGAPAVNDFVSPPVARLDRILEWIPHLQSLGCDALYMGPVFESDFHGYDTADYFTVDRRLGTNNSPKTLAEALRQAEIRLVLDTVFNHVGRNFPAFKDLQAQGRSSVYRDWFCGVDFERQSTYGDPFYYEGWYDAHNLVRLNLQNPEVRAFLFSVIDHWITAFDVDGLRLDVTEIMDRGFLKAMAAYCRRRKPEIWLLGEMITGDYRELACPAMLNSVTNYELHEALTACHQRLDYTILAKALQRQFGINGHYLDLPLYTFADNPDTTRAASLLGDQRHPKLIYTLLFTLPGIPSVYYGSEWGVTGIKGAHEDTDLRPEVSRIPGVSDNPLFLYLQQLIRIRHHHPVLSQGDYRPLLVGPSQLVFCRQSGEHVCVVSLNLAAENVSVQVDMKDLPPLPLTDALDASLSRMKSGEDMEISIPASGAKIFISTSIP